MGDELKLLITAYLMPFCRDLDMAKRMSDGLFSILNTMGYEVVKKRKKKARMG